MELKDILIRKTASHLQQTEELVALVISHSYKKLNEAVKTNDDLEISGFGILKLSQAKTKKRIIRCEKAIEAVTGFLETETEEKKIKKYQTMLESSKTNLEYYKSRLNE